MIGLGMGFGIGKGGSTAIVPSLDLAFALDKTLVARRGPTPTFTRASTGTFIGSNGLIQSAAINAPRFDHDPLTGECKGLLIEELRSNLVFPSDVLTTQTRTVAATAHTLSFYGTGTVVISGAHLATVVGTGAFPARTVLTFTPTAGSLTLTVTGSVTQAQVEAGAFPTSYIPTTTAPVTRSADVCSIADTSSFWNNSEFTLLTNANFQFASIDSYASNFQITGGFFGVRRALNNTITGIMRSSGANADINFGVFSTGSAQIALARSANNQAGSMNGGSVIENSVAFAPSLNPVFVIGAPSTTGGGVINGHIARIQYFRKRLPNAKLQALTQ